MVGVGSLNSDIRDSKEAGKKDSFWKTQPVLMHRHTYLFSTQNIPPTSLSLLGLPSPTIMILIHTLPGLCAGSS